MAVLDYEAALIEQNQLLGDAIFSADLGTPVPTCPGWTLLQLMRHVGRGDRWAAHIINTGGPGDLDPRTVPDGRPPDDLGGARAWLQASPVTVIKAVGAVGPDTLASTFLGPRPAAWWIRRRLHEATVHRADAMLATGERYELSPELAADGIEEWLERLTAELRSADEPASARLTSQSPGALPDSRTASSGAAAFPAPPRRQDWPARRPMSSWRSCGAGRRAKRAYCSRAIPVPGRSG